MSWLRAGASWATGRDWRRRLGSAVFLAAALGWFVLLRPAFLGGTAGYVIVTGTSMQPTLYEGDLAVLRRQETYEVGDVVAFQVGGGQVIHRIIGGDATAGYALQGDNRDYSDLWQPRADQVLGRMWLRVPSGGSAILWLRQPLHLAAFVGLCSFISMMTGDERKPAGPRRAEAGT